MTDNIMYYPAIILMVVEAGALVFLICAWIKAKKDVEGLQALCCTARRTSMRLLLWFGICECRRFLFLRRKERQ